MLIPATTVAVFCFFYSFCLLPFFLQTPCLAQLSTSFYATSCPQAVSTISNTFVSLAKQDNVVAPSTLRLILHDCFVEGCDGSILLSSTPGNTAERDAPDNVNLPQNSFNAIIQAKKAVEQLCPGVVSCADIVALAARDSVVFLGGPSYEVPLGRLDGRVSTAASVAGRLPEATFDVNQLAENFASVGLSLEDMVVLSGAHTIGFSHCDQFRNRLYDFNSTVKVDPSMDPTFVQQLQKQCPASGSDGFVPFDFVTPFVFDNNYYKDLEARKGLLFSDQVLFQDASTRATVQSMGASQSLFFTMFTSAMIKMSAIGVKQGAQGEVRKDCTKVNAGGAVTPVLSPPPPITPTVSPPSIAASSPPPPNIAASSPPPLLPSSRPPASLPPPPPTLSSPPPITHTAVPPPSSPSSPPPAAPLQKLPPPPFLLLSPPPAVLKPPGQEAQPSPPAEEAPLPLPPPPPPPRGGFTIPGIPGFLPPIHVPLPPAFNSRPSPPSGTSTAAKSSSEHV